MNSVEGFVGLYLTTLACWSVLIWRLGGGQKRLILIIGMTLPGFVVSLFAFGPLESDFVEKHAFIVISLITMAVSGPPFALHLDFANYRERQDEKWAFSVALPNSISLILGSFVALIPVVSIFTTLIAVLALVIVDKARDPLVPPQNLPIELEVHWFLFPPFLHLLLLFFPFLFLWMHLETREPLWLALFVFLLVGPALQVFFFFKPMRVHFLSDKIVLKLLGRTYFYDWLKIEKFEVQSIGVVTTIKAACKAGTPIRQVLRFPYYGAYHPRDLVETLNALLDAGAGSHSIIQGRT